jgi:hypothetical protein
MEDSIFRLEAGRLGLEINPVPGSEIDKLIAEVYRTPKDVIAEARSAAERTH